MALAFGTDLDATITVANAYGFGLAICVIVPLIACPLISHGRVMAFLERDRAVIELRRISQTDQLTGLLNRRGFDAAAAAAAASTHACGAPLSVFMLDIDLFKSINDRFGHDFGDAVLVRIAELLREVARAEDFIVARQGGEEFVALLPGVTGAKAVAIAETIRETCLETPVDHDGNSTAITVSIGVATRWRAGATVSELLSDADGTLPRQAWWA
jgi:diguanylate cyclase (GGDEF)-like protein